VGLSSIVVVLHPAAAHSISVGHTMLAIEKAH
jgi:hypothetical protein